MILKADHCNVNNMNGVITKAVISVSLLSVLAVFYSAVSLPATARSHSPPTLLLNLLHSAAQNGLVNISVNDTVTTSNIDVSKKSNIDIPVIIPAGINPNGPIRLCVTVVPPSDAQICTTLQHIKQDGKNRVTLDLAHAIAG